MTLENIVFILVLATAATLFARSALRLISYLRVARPDDRFGNVGARLVQTLRVGFGQSKILRDRVAGPIHASIFWGFLILLASAAEMILEGLHGWSLNFLGPLYGLLTFLTDFFCVAVMLGCVFALWRRYVSRVPRLKVPGESAEAGMILLTILLIVTALFLQNATRVYATGVDFSHALRPLSGPFGRAVFAAAVPGVVHSVFKAAWWTHAVLILAFLNYLPYSKHLHVLTSILNVYFSPVGPVQLAESTLKPS